MVVHHLHSVMGGSRNFNVSGCFMTPSNFYIHTYIHKLYLSSDFSVAYIASISDPNLLIKSYNIII